MGGGGHIERPRKWGKRRGRYPGIPFRRRGSPSFRSKRLKWNFLGRVRMVKQERQKETQGEGGIGMKGQRSTRGQDGGNSAGGLYESIFSRTGGGEKSMEN